MPSLSQSRNILFTICVWIPCFIYLVLLSIILSFYNHFMKFCVFEIKLLRFNYDACRNPDDRIILNTLQLSHYVEKVRWCMDRAGIDYEEEKDIGIFFAIVIGRMVPTLIIPKHEISISNSSEILKYLYADLLNKDEEKAKFMEPSVKNRELEIKIEEMGDNLRTYFYYHVSIFMALSCAKLGLKFK